CALSGQHAGERRRTEGLGRTLEPAGTFAGEHEGDRRGARQSRLTRETAKTDAPSDGRHKGRNRAPAEKTPALHDRVLSRYRSGSRFHACAVSYSPQRHQDTKKRY